MPPRRKADAPAEGEEAKKARVTRGTAPKPDPVEGIFRPETLSAEHRAQKREAYKEAKVGLQPPCAPSLPLSGGRPMCSWGQAHVGTLLLAQQAHLLFDQTCVACAVSKLPKVPWSTRTVAAASTTPHPTLCPLRSPTSTSP